MKRIEAGASFGPAALFHGHGDNAVDFAVKARARILALSEPLLERLMREDFQIALNYIRFLSGRIYYLNARIHSISGAHTERALARYLCGEYENAADGDTVSVRPSFAELAKRLNMGRACSTAPWTRWRVRADSEAGTADYHSGLRRPESPVGPR